MVTLHAILSIPRDLVILQPAFSHFWSMEVAGRFVDCDMHTCQHSE